MAFPESPYRPIFEALLNKDAKRAEKELLEMWKSRVTVEPKDLAKGIVNAMSMFDPGARLLALPAKYRIDFRRSISP